MIYKYEAEILRNGISIGYFNLEGGNIKFDSKAKVKKASQITVSAEPFFYKVVDYTVDNRTYPSVLLFPSSNTFMGIYEKTIKDFKLELFNDRIQLSVIKNGDKYILGKFLVVSAPIKYEVNKKIMNLELYDESIILSQKLTDERLFVAAGTNYINAILSLLADAGFDDVKYDTTDLTLTIDKEYEIGISYLDIINELLSEINFNQLYIDNLGNVILKKDVESYTPTHIYNPDKVLIEENYSNEEDIYMVPNVFIGMVSTPDKELLTYKKENVDILFKLSIPNRGFKITEIHKLKDIASQGELEDFINKRYLDSLNILETVNVTTEIEGNHGLMDLIQLDLKVKGLFKETSYTINFTSNNMQHVLERNNYE